MAKWTKLDLEVKAKQMESLKLLYGEQETKEKIPKKPISRYQGSIKNRNLKKGIGRAITRELRDSICQKE